MQTSGKATRGAGVDAVSALHEQDPVDGVDEQRPDGSDDWHEDRLSLAIRVIEALGLRPVGAAASVLH